MDMTRQNDVIKLFNAEFDESIKETDCMMINIDYNPEIPSLNTAKEYFELYYLYQRANFKDKANKALAMAVKLEPRNIDYLREYAATGYKNKAYHHWNEREIYDPIKAANLLIELEGNNPHNYLIRAHLYQHWSKREQAIDDIITAIKLGLNDSKIYEMLGDIYAEDLQYEMAVKSYTHAINLSVCNSNLYLKRGNVFFDMENDKEAFYNANQSLYYNPENTEAHYLKYQIYSKYNYSSFAIISLEKSLKKNIFKSEDEHRLSLLADSYHKGKIYKNEIKYLNILLAFEDEYKSLQVSSLKRKLKALFLSFRLFEVLPVFLFLLKAQWKKLREYKLYDEFID